ncbi:4'-phosphopantetheinyl transferase superfamily protein [Arthrobacter sp. JZ12]|uniref:4'-phosphopantetheinyl transferase family protein n=1 Tax=Arthrobacter sp. JZ12 TaxID=2654190 RepID=UPI002B4704C0|nr:4'-phosphopantetheinyl transferase superfamily protein [Arthrobacter sp. JZ12]WRH24825.1 4'-phosphopantetheinyl transferase superfamily protein [Arthrobacter sp. JZ12]
MEIHAVRLDGHPVEELDDGERVRGGMLVDPAVRHRFLAGRSWLRGLVSRASGEPAGRLVSRSVCPACAEDNHGRPGFFVGSKEVPVSVSLSRSGGWAVAVLDRSGAQQSLGIDLEQIDRFEGNGLDLDIFTPAERAAVRAADEDRRPDVRAVLWSRKEAVLKAAGTGLLIEPGEVDVLADTVTVESCSYSVSNLDPEELGLPQGFVVALARGR